MNPTNTVFDAKRLIGRTMNDKDLQQDIKHWPFSVKANSHGKPSIHVSYRGEDKQFVRATSAHGVITLTTTQTPEEISAMVLTNLKETAESYLGEKVTHAVVTVPACKSRFVRIVSPLNDIIQTSTMPNAKQPKTQARLPD